MVDLSKYPMKGICRFPNIFEQLALGRVRSVYVEADRGFLDDWEIGIHVEQIDGVMHLYPFISYERRFYPEVRIGSYLGIDKSKYCVERKVFLRTRWYGVGIRMKLTDLKPEFLNNGALIIQYGVWLEAIKTSDRVWNFQLLTDLYDSKGKQVMIRLWKNERSCRCHPQIKAIHYDNLIGNKQKHPIRANHIAAQIAHGVRFQQLPSDIVPIASNARDMGLQNVIQYCQWQLIRKPFADPTYVESNEVKIAVDFNMRSYLVHLLRKYKTKNKLMDILKGVDIDMMSGESMKTFMKFLLFE